MEDKARRSAGFTNCLGALIKRIRFEHGYRSNEAGRRFHRPTDCKWSVHELREALREYGTHRHCEYVLALPTSFRRTASESIDPALASLLHIRVLLISEKGAEELDW
jgi:hypothetical protein